MGYNMCHTTRGSWDSHKWYMYILRVVYQHLETTPTPLICCLGIMYMYSVVRNIESGTTPVRVKLIRFCGTVHGPDALWVHAPEHWRAG